MSWARPVASLIAALTLAGTSVAAPASASERVASSEPPPTPLASAGTVTVETYDATRRVIGKASYGPETEGQLMGGSSEIAAKGSGTGGTSSASGCRRVTINNRFSTFLGGTAFRFHTWTRWCWTRSSQSVHSVSTGWYTSDIDFNYAWRGILNREVYFYDYGPNDGHPRSAYRHYRQGLFENCVIKYGCIGNYYPANILRSYYNGTWNWETN